MEHSNNDYFGDGDVGEQGTNTNISMVQRKENRTALKDLKAMEGTTILPAEKG